jgi:putative DNA primase/helicase
MAIKSELGDAGFDIWDEWSPDSKSTTERKDTWKSIRDGGAKAVGLGSLIYEAKQRGWTEETNYKPPTKAELEARQAARAARDAEAALKLAEDHAFAAEEAERLWAAGRPADGHPYLVRKGVKNHGLRVGPWFIVDEDTGEVRQVTNNGLYVPMRDRTGKLHSLQCISQREDGGKKYLKNGCKRGHFFAVGGKPKLVDGNPVFCLGEGYATCASAHEASGHLVLTCFDTSNLMTIAVAIRERNPNAIIIMLADNDADKASNPGLKTALKVAMAVGALVAVPVLADAPESKCDFNDVFLADGPEAVETAIRAATASALPPTPEPPPPAEKAPEPLPDPIPEPIAETEGDEVPEYLDVPHPEEEAAAAPAVHKVPVDIDEEGDEITNNGYFAILGYNGDQYYFFHHAKKQVLTRTRGDFSDTGLIELADINWWESYFPMGGKAKGIDKLAACAWIFGVAHARGIYDTSKVRGRGAWHDHGRYVFHHGDRLTVDGEQMDITDIRSAYVYPMSKRMPAPSPTPLTNEEGAQMVETAELVRWSMPASAALMAGWVFLSPICGALKWRPHIWITGEAGTGKSTIQSDFCQAPLRGIGKYFAGGNSTEPGIRQNLQSDAVPALIDELEPNDERDRLRISAVLTMIRQSSSESMAETAKGTVSGDGMQYHIRSMFCVASINTMLDKDSDSSRLTKLVIRPTRPGDNDNWEELEERLHKMTSDDELPGRLLARALNMLPTILVNVKAFTAAAGKFFGKQRIGDQLGTLMAGAWCLMQDTAATEEQALAMIQAYNWTEHNDSGGANDPTKALGSVLEAKIRVNGTDYSVYELVERAANGVGGPAALDMAVCQDTLKRNGMRIEKDPQTNIECLLFANTSPALRDLVAKTAYATDLRGQLLRVDNATKMDNKSFKFSGTPSKVVGIPLNQILEPDNGLPI